MLILEKMDMMVLLWIQDYLRVSITTPFWKFITLLGNGGWFWILVSVLLIFLKKTRYVGVTALVSIMMGFIVTNLILKNVIARPRPFDVTSAVIPLITKPADFSFPSGHTCASFSAALVYYRMLPKKYGISALLLASMIAFSRLYLGVHYPSDITGGIAIAFIVSSLAALGVKKCCWRKQEVI